MKPFDSYIICTSPRSGSTLLCRMLREIGHAGFPDSHFHEPSLEKWLGYHRLNADDFDKSEDVLRAIFDAAHQTGCAGSGIFGLRLQRRSFDFFMQQLKVLHPSCDGDKARVEREFGRTLFIHLTRQSKLDQAISVVKATQTGLWHKAPDGTELERNGAAQEPVYDATAISAEMAVFVKADEDWKLWFAAQDIKPLRISYDDLSADPYAQLSRIVAALGLAYEPADKTVVPVAKLSDNVSREWADRFRSEGRDLTC